MDGGVSRMRKSDLQEVFGLHFDFRDPVRRRMFSLIKSRLERALSLDRLNELYGRIPKEEGTLPYLRAALEAMNIRCRVSDGDLSRIPPEGRLVVVANHPFGAVEGLLLASILSPVRQDTRIMANYLLKRIPELRELFIFVNPFGTRSATRMNLQPLKNCIQWLHCGGVLGVFPAGEVSHVHLRSRRITDPPWSNTIAGLVRRTEAPVLPVFFQGVNSALFQILGLVHPRLRTALLPHELLNKMNREISVRIGAPVSFRKLREFDRDDDLTSYLRLRTYMLAGRVRSSSSKERKKLHIGRRKPVREPIAPPISAELLLREVHRLPEDQKLLEQGKHLVCFARSDQIPNLLTEIGRLREIAFREAGEGSGKALDLDRFDRYYLHLFVWNREAREVVGAYRLGPTDRILSRFGKSGLYSSTLFKYKTAFLGRIDPALELGRSFVHPSYQKSFAPLLLLWKGIALYVSSHPRYKNLFGPVSIDREYHSVSQQIMVDFLRVNNYLPEMARWVKAKKPPPGRRSRRSLHFPPIHAKLKDIEELSALISDIEARERGVPVLLRQYLKLGGKLLGFNIDHQFNEVLDGLILVDLTQTDPRLLDRYMGKDKAASFLAFHGAASASSPAFCA